MDFLILFVGTGLTILWIVGLATGGVTSWFLWLTFLAAITLLLVGAFDLVQARRARPRTPA